MNKYVVYVLEDSRGNSYVGFTSNINRRLQEHRNGHTKTTKKMENIRLVYGEEVSTSAEARTREKYLKSAAGRRFRKYIVPR